MPAIDPSIPERCVILRINIGEDHHHWVGADDALRLAAAANPILLSLERPDFDRETFTPRQWRGLARELDQLIEDARDAVKGGARVLVIGRAPLPVFAYLGVAMVRFGGIVVANDFKGEWQMFGSRETAPIDESPGTFTVVPPQLGRSRDGRLALSIQCSAEYSDPASSIDELLSAEQVSFLGAYAIHRPVSRDVVPLTHADLPKILEHVETGLAWIIKEAPKADSLVVPLAAPNWVAFWVGHRLNPTVCGRFDFPNFVPGLGYRRALSWPMAKAPWLADKASLLLLQAEPKNQGRVEAGRSYDVVQTALERELGRNGPFSIRFEGAMKIREFIRSVELGKPDILHLHLHGTEDDHLVFEDERGESAYLSVEKFVARLKAARVEPTLIVLHACYVDALGKALVGIAECVVHMRGKVAINDAIEFSRSLYGAIGRGNDLDTALEQACASVSVDVEVHSVGNLRKSDIVLMPRPRAK